MSQNLVWTASRAAKLSLMGTETLYGVRTTLIFCRIGCPSRAPKPENVVYFSAPEEAVLLGFRACKRCRPDLEQSELLSFQKDTVERFLTLAKTQPWKTIGELAQELALSRRQLERTTIAVTGLPPRRLIDQERASL